jgi:RHS repeat-associated protein
VVRTTHPDGAFSTATYSSGADNRPFVTMVDELGHEHTTWSDVDGHTTTVREKNGAAYYTTGYRYDALGRLVSWTDAAGNSSAVGYNSLGWKTSIADMDAGTWRYGYDNGGLLTSQTDARNQQVTMAYDVLGRLTSRTEPGNQVSRWFYDEAGFGASVGRLTRTTYPAGSDSHTWNKLGQETTTSQCVDTVCKSMSTAFDSADRLKALTYPDGETVSYTYNAAGQLSTVSGYVAAMTWSPGGQLTSMTYANGTTTSYSYDTNREWLTAAKVTSGTATLYQASYGYNAGGLITTMSQGTPGAASTNYSYDDLDRLASATGAQNQTFSYDAVGNITSNSLVGSYSYADPAHKHAVTTAGAASYTYDANGNTTSGAGRTLTWDGGNRLASVTQAAATTTFAYEPAGQRVKKVFGPNTTRYFGDHVEDVNGTLVKYYYAGPVLVARSAGGVKTWYHSDRLGSTRLITGATGTEARDYDYLPFGAQSSTGSAANERTFTGHVRDDSTGLLYMNARYQDPTVGRFVSPDTEIPDLDEPQDINRYSYVRNNPVNNVDVTGNAPAGCNAACIRSWAKAQNDAAKKRASAKHHSSPAHHSRPPFNQDRWERQARARLGRHITRHIVYRPAPHKRACDEIWCYRTRSGQAKRKADVSAPDSRANNKNYAYTCSRGPANYGPEACGYRYVGPTLDYPKYCRGVCVVGAFWPGDDPSDDPQSTTVQGTASQLVRIRFRNLAWHAVHVAIHGGGHTVSGEVGPGSSAEFRMSRIEFPVNRPGNTLASHRYVIEVHNPTSPLAFQVCSGDCGPRRFVTTNPNVPAQVLPDLPF